MCVYYVTIVTCGKLTKYLYGVSCLLLETGYNAAVLGCIYIVISVCSEYRNTTQLLQVLPNTSELLNTVLVHN